MIYNRLRKGYVSMSSTPRKFRIGSFTWFLMISLVILAYYFLFPEMTTFYIVAGITILIMFALMFFVRTDYSKGVSKIDNRIQNYHTNKLRRREQASQKFETNHNENPPLVVNFCKKCKRKLDKDSTFCSHCGYEVK